MRCNTYAIPIHKMYKVYDVLACSTTLPSIPLYPYSLLSYFSATTVISPIGENAAVDVLGIVISGGVMSN